MYDYSESSSLRYRFSWIDASSLPNIWELVLKQNAELDLWVLPSSRFSQLDTVSLQMLPCWSSCISSPPWSPAYSPLTKQSCQVPLSPSQSRKIPYCYHITCSILYPAVKGPYDLHTLISTQLYILLPNWIFGFYVLHFSMTQLTTYLLCKENRTSKYLAYIPWRF